MFSDRVDIFETWKKMKDLIKTIGYILAIIAFLIYCLTVGVWDNLKRLGRK